MFIALKDVKMFFELLGTIQKVAPSAKFIVSPEGVSINSLNPSGNIVAMFSSTCAFSNPDERFEFSIVDLSKLQKLIKLVLDSNLPSPIMINFTGNFLTFDNVVKFKLKTVKDAIIDNVVAKNTNRGVTSVVSFTTNSNDLIRIIKCFSIIDDAESKVYFYVKDGVMMAEIDNKANPTSNSVGMPLSKNIIGDLTKCMTVATTVFKMFNILNSDNINIVYSTNNLFEITSSASRIIEEQDKNETTPSKDKKEDTKEHTSLCTINVKMLCSAIKG